MKLSLLSDKIRAKLGNPSPQSQLFQRTFPEDLAQYDDEYLRYCVEKDRVETILEKTLHTTDDPTEIMDITLQTVCHFYGGDWAGVMDIDMDTCIWSLKRWYRAGGETDTTLARVHDLEDAEAMPSWLVAMEKGIPVVLPDVSVIKESYPMEYAVYDRLGAYAVMASPFAPTPTGFLVIRNPTRYLDRPEALFIFAYVLHRALAQQNTMEREEIIEEMNPMNPNYDVDIHFFRDLEICTPGGTLTEQMINAPKTIPVIAYLLLKPERAHSPREIFENLNPGVDFDGNTNAIRGSIYRFSNLYARRTGQSLRLIIHEGSGYRRNPDMKITTDLEQFDTHIKAANLARDSAVRIDELSQAVELYKGPVYMRGRDQIWMKDIISQYEVRYIKAVDALMRELAKNNDYPKVMQYATKANELFPGNGLVCYWIIVATYRLSGADMAQKEFVRLRENMTEDEIEVVTFHLQHEQPLQYRDLSGV